MAEALQPVLSRVASAALRDGLRDYGIVSKADEPVDPALLALIERFGVRQYHDSANRAEVLIAGFGSARPGILGRELPDVAAMQARAGSVAIDTRAEIYRMIQQIIADAQFEDPTPSNTVIARRIRNAVSGLSSFSFERAYTIARTEMGIAENTGAVAGYKALGVDKIEWIAVTTDRRSGERRHWEMDGAQISIGDKFTLPSGARLSHPLDPFGPVGEIVNCRCTHRAVL